MKEPISIRLKSSFLLLAVIVLMPLSAFAASAPTPLRLLYPSFSSSWATAWIAKEAGYFLDEGLDVELIRVGGSTRMVAAMLGGSAPIIQAGAAAALAATAAGSDVVIIGATGTVSPFRLMARPEIKQPSDLKGKKAGITTFGSTSDQVVRIALKKFNLEPNKDVALLSLGAQPEVFAALQSGAIDVGALSFPLYPKAAQLGMRELVNFGSLGVEDINGTVITTRSYIAKNRETALGFMRAFTRGMHRYRTDKEFSKRVLAKYGKVNDAEILEGTWQDYAPTMQKNPRPSLKAIQYLIENQFKDKKPLPKPEQFVDTSLVDQLEKSGFIDSVNK
ncbi:MAG TPA: ABC transporter substrate-binding protein [Candidatus Binatia bacterium]|jgi:NitT/TauT family transport system substrate-binding protein